MKNAEINLYYLERENTTLYATFLILSG